MTHPRLVETLMRPDFYPHGPASVQLIQTHISFIFIAGNEVYKVKKAADFGFLDFTSLAKRKFYCQEELRLNRRLAPDVYLAVVEISEDDGGDLHWGPEGRVVDYAVRMKRLPEERMLKRLLGEGALEPSVMEAIAGKLADFHQRAETGGAIDAGGGIETIRRNHEENFDQTSAYVGVTIPPYQHAFLQAYTRDFLDRTGSLLRKRVAEHRIRDCHGDLHLEHICLADDIVIFDCIEFNERFRHEDVAAEVAFLAMDLDFNGYAPWADAFVTAYVRHSGDGEIPLLLDFYRCYYACVRGKVVGFRLNDPAIRPEDREDARRLASRYFDLAYTYAARLKRPALILAAGLMGTGKSLLSRNMAPRIGAEVIRTDVLRKELLRIDPAERHHEDFGQGIYGEDFSRRTYEAALDLAAGRLRNGQSVIIDASWKRRADRLRAERLARELGVDFFVVECTCPEDDIRRRLQSRLAKQGEASDGRWEIFKAQQADFEGITEFSDGTYLLIDTAGPREASMDAALRRLKALPPPC